MPKISNYYYEKLNKEQQKAYFAIKEGLLNMQEEFLVPKLSGKELSDIYFMIRLDCPEIFYSVKFSYKYYEDSPSVIMVPEYLFTKDKLREHKQAMQSRILKIARQAEGLDEKGKEVFIHDFIVQNVKYDKLKKEYSHEIIGALGNGVAVCEGMAKAVKALCDQLGIWCIIALSDNNPDKGIKYRHTWNIVKIGGKYYHLDVTFDNSLTRDDIIRYDYFNLSDKQIVRDHEPVIWKVPACEDNDGFYYKEKKVSWTTFDEVRNRTRQAVKKGKVLLFHWRGGYLTREVLKDILDIFEEEAAAKNKISYTSVNWPQAVIRARFEEKVAEDEGAHMELDEAVNVEMEEAMHIEMEEANEGELL